MQLVYIQLIYMQYPNCESTFINYNVVENLEIHLMTRQIFKLNFFVRLALSKMLKLIELRKGKQNMLKANLSIC